MGNAEKVGEGAVLQRVTGDTTNGCGVPDNPGQGDDGGVVWKMGTDARKDLTERRKTDKKRGEV